MSRFGTDQREQREQVAAFAQRAKENRAKLQEVQAELDKARAAFAEGGAGASEVAELMGQRDRIQQEAHEVESGQRQLLGQLAPGGGANGGFDLDPSSPLAQTFADPEFAEQMRRIASSSQRLQDVQLGEIPRDDVARWLGVGRSLGRGFGDGFMATGPTGNTTTSPLEELVPGARVVPILAPPTTILDLFPSGVMDGPVYPFVVEGVPDAISGIDVAAPVQPGSVKPAVDLTYTDASTASQTIAGWTKLNRQSLMDVPVISGTIQGRLLFKCRQALEKQIVSGDGTVSDSTAYKGIVGFTVAEGIQHPDVSGDANDVDAILTGIVALLARGANPNFVALNPTDYATLLKSKSSGSGEYVASPFLTTVSRIWNVTFLPAVACPVDTCILGDTTIGANLLFREGAHVVVGQEQDDLSRNRVTILAELRAALAITIPAAFAVFSL